MDIPWWNLGTREQFAKLSVTSTLILICYEHHAKS
jgi:hypothetical protein